MFAHRHSDGKEQFDAVFAAMRASDALLALGRDGRGQDRFTTASMLNAEQALVKSADALAALSHRVDRIEVELTAMRGRSEGRRGGKDGVRKFRFRWGTELKHKKQ